MTDQKRPETARNGPKQVRKTAKPREKVSEPMTNSAAVARTIEALRKAGKLAEIDEARIRIVVGLAAAVDTMPDNPSMWREYRAAEKALREEALAHGDPFDQLIASLTAEIRDEEKQEAPKPRTRGGGDR